MRTTSWWYAGLALLLACAAEPSVSGGGTGGSGGTAGTAGAAGAAGSSGIGGFSGFGGSGGFVGLLDASPDGNDTCAEAEVRPTRRTPTVVFLIDGSRSMEATYSDDQSRWHALRAAMLDPTDGVVSRLDGIVDFGMVIYNDEEAAPPATQVCPTLIEVPSANQNLANITAAFPNAPPGFNTPTGAALHQLVSSLPDVTEVQTRGLGPQVVILATDGEPYECTDWEAFWDNDVLPAVDYDSVVNAATLGQTRGITTYVISLAEATGAYAAHLNEVAQVGGSASAFSPSSGTELINRITSIVTSTVSCQVNLNGTVEDDMECEGTVTLGSTTLGCNDDNGFRLIDRSHLELTGAACLTFQTDPSATLVARFPCGSYIPG